MVNPKRHHGRHRGVKISEIVDNSSQIDSTYWSSYVPTDWSIMIASCSIYCVYVFYSIINLLERFTDGHFLFLCKTVVLLFVLFLNLSAQIRFPQNRYTDLKSALDQLLVVFLFLRNVFFFCKKFLRYLKTA